MPQKNRFQIEASHPALGTVLFIIAGEDNKAAFALWKQVVGSSRQWVVKSNAKYGDASEADIDDIEMMP